MSEDSISRNFKLKCEISTWEIFRLSLASALVVAMTFGLALPLCFFEIGKILINNTKLEIVSMDKSEKRLEGYLNNNLKEKTKEQSSDNNGSI